MQADAVNGRDADGAGNDVLDLLQAAVERIVSLDDLLAEIVEHLPFAGEAKLFLAPFDEQRFELPLERTDLLADSRLRDAVDLCSLGEALGFSEIAEDF